MKTPDNIQIFLKKVWDETGESPVEAGELEALHSAMGITRKGHLKRVNKWALAFLAAASLAIGEFIFLKKPVTPVETVSLVTAAGSKGDFLLPDGSRVWLNASSRLTYDASATRTVSLDGEAFFDVAKNGSTFSVRTTDLEIKVMGTRFNVRSNANLGPDEVSLVSGKVEVNSQGATQLLYPGEKAALENGVLAKRSADVTIDSCWTGDELVFQNTSLQDILESLEHWYSVNFQTSSGLNLSQRLSFKIRKESMGETLTIIRRLTGCRVKTLDDNNILITK